MILKYLTFALGLVSKNKNQKDIIASENTVSTEVIPIEKWNNTKLIATRFFAVAPTRLFLNRANKSKDNADASKIKNEVVKTFSN